MLKNQKLIFLSVLTMMFSLMWVFYVGFQATDDKSYLEGALGWVESFPYVGTNHWELRHPMTLPAAVFIRLFGLNEFAISLVNTVYFTLFVLTNYWFVKRFVGYGSAIINALILITLPGFIVLATYMEIGVPEVFYLSISFWFYRAALEVPGKTLSWVLCGVALGLSFITRETAASLILFFGLLFLFKPMVARVRYMYLFGASAMVLALDWTYLMVMTGNPFYRFTIDLHHDKIDRFALVSQVVNRKGFLDSEGNITVNVFIDPILNLFISQKYTLIFWLFVLAIISFWRRRTTVQIPLTLELLIGYVFVSFLFLGANPKLYLVPRYFIITSWAASIIVAWWLVSIFQQKRYLFSSLAGLAILGGNFAALSVENTNPRFIEKALLAYSIAHPGEKIFTDVETIYKAKYYFRFAGQPLDLISSARPPEGATFFYSANRLASCEASTRCRDHVLDYLPNQNWIERQIIRPTPRPIGNLLRVVGIEKFLPVDIRKKLLLEGGDVAVYTTADAD